MTAEEAQSQAAESAYRYLTSQKNPKNPSTSSQKIPSAIDLLNRKYLKKEIVQPTYSFKQIKENKKLLWLCTLTLNDNAHRVSATAISRKKAKQAAAQGMLAILENDEKTKGLGLLKRAMLLRGE